MVSGSVGVAVILQLSFMQHPWIKFVAGRWEVGNVSGTQTLQFPWGTEPLLACVL